MCEINPLVRVSGFFLCVIFLLFAFTNMLYNSDCHLSEKGEWSMRLDKYLKVSRIIKRRTVAKDVCDGGKVKINGKVAKAGAEVKPGDILEIGFGERKVRAEILEVKENVRAEDAKTLYQLLEGQEID